jgi:hypothetical protein
MDSSKISCSNCNKQFASKQMLQYHLKKAVCKKEEVQDEYGSLFEIVKFLQKEVKELKEQVINLNDEISKLKEKKKKSPSPSRLAEGSKEKKSKSPSKPSPPPPVPSRIAEDSKIAIKKNKFGNFEHNSTGFLFNSSKKVYGRQKDDGSIIPLTKEDIDLCKSSKFPYEVIVKQEEEQVVIKVEEVEEVNEDEEHEDEEHDQKQERMRQQIYDERKNLNDIEGNLFFDKDEKGKYHINGYPKSQFDNLKSLTSKEDRECSKTYKSLNKKDKERMNSFFNHQRDTKKLNELQEEYDNFIYS